MHVCIVRVMREATSEELAQHIESITMVLPIFIKPTSNFFSYFFILDMKPVVVNLEEDEEKPLISKKRSRSRGVHINEPSYQIIPKISKRKSSELSNTINE
jgi:hypothetical protein